MKKTNLARGSALYWRYQRHVLSWIWLAIGAALRLAFLQSGSLWFDEAKTITAASVPLGRLIPVVGAMESAPPFYHLVMHFWLKLFADPLLGVRLFSALCGIAALAAFLHLCRRLAPGREAFAGLIGALSSFWVHYSQDGRGYALVLLMAILAATLFLELRERWSWPAGLAYAFLGALGLYTHTFFAFLLLSQALFLAWENRARPQALGPWLALYGLMLAAYAPWLSYLRLQIQAWRTTSVVNAPFTFSELCTMIGTMTFDTSFLSISHPGLTKAIGLFSLALAGAGVWIPGKERRTAALAGALWIGPLAAAKAAELATGLPLAQARYFIFLSPFLYINLAAAIERWKGRAASLAQGLVAAVIAAGTAGYFLSSHLIDTRLPLLSSVIRQEADRRRPIIHLESFYYMPMRVYYLPERAHFVLGRATATDHWAAFPGYPAALSDRKIAGLGPCAVVDPARILFENRVGLATGRQLADALGLKVK